MMKAETDVLAVENEAGVLVWRNQDGAYFVVKGETLEQGRVSADQTAELVRLIAEAPHGGADGEDVQGHVVPLVVAGGLAFGYGVLMGARIAEHLMRSSDTLTAPDLSGIRPSPEYIR